MRKVILLITTLIQMNVWAGPSNQVILKMTYVPGKSALEASVERVKGVDIYTIKKWEDGKVVKSKKVSSSFVQSALSMAREEIWNVQFKSKPSKTCNQQWGVEIPAEKESAKVCKGQLQAEVNLQSLYSHISKAI